MMTFIVSDLAKEAFCRAQISL